MIIVTGASGNFGRHAVLALLDRGVLASRIRVVVRDPGKVTDLAARGIDVRTGDYDQPEGLVAAFEGGDRLLLVSSSEVGRRVPQHQNAVDAAKAAGVGRIAYTSILNLETNGSPMAGEHAATEEIIHRSGLEYTMLRNGWYIENYTENLGPALQFGTIFGSAGSGRIAGATRADYAAAAAAVIAEDGHGGRVYELAGAPAFTMADLASAVSAASGREVTYSDLPAEEYAHMLATTAGLPQPVAEMLAASDLAVARGELDSTDRDLQGLIGRPSTPLAAIVQSAVMALTSAPA